MEVKAGVSWEEFSVGVDEPEMAADGSLRFSLILTYGDGLALKMPGWRIYKEKLRIPTRGWKDRFGQQKYSPVVEMSEEFGNLVVALARFSFKAAFPKVVFPEVEGRTYKKVCAGGEEGVVE